MSEITRILSKINDGDPAATNELFPVVYDELRTLAAHMLNHEQPGLTLQATALVHEVYLRLGNLSWDNVGHFFAAAAKAMRRILVEKAREKKAQKRGGGQRKLNLENFNLEHAATEDEFPFEELLALHEALEKFARVDPEKERLVELRFFAGLTIAQAAEIIGKDPSTADRWWMLARIWLHKELTGSDDSPDSEDESPE